MIMRSLCCSVMIMRLKLSCLKDPSNGLVMGTDDNSMKSNE